MNYFGWESWLVLFGGIVWFLLQQDNPRFRLAKILFAWIVFTSMRTSIFPLSPYLESPIDWRLTLSHDGVLSLVTFLILFMASFVGKKEHYALFFKLIFLANFLTMLIGKFYDAPYGLLLNPSMSGCFQVALFPLFIESEWLLPALVMMVWSVLLSHQSLPLALLFLFFFLKFVKNRNYVMATLLPVIALISGKFLLKGELLATSGRTQLWDDTYRWAVGTSSYLFGAGGGSFSSLGPLISKDYGEFSVFTYLHSDWLQIAFEQGIIGLALAVLFFIWLLRHARGKTLGYAILLYGAFMVANMPLRYPLVSLYAFFLVRQVLID